MVHDEGHELRQNEALRLLAGYVREVRSNMRAHYALTGGDPVAEVEKILGVGEEPPQSALNQPVPSAEEARRLAAKLAIRKLAEKPAAEREDSEED